MLKAASHSLGKMKEEIMEKKRLKFKAENKVLFDSPPRLPELISFEEHVSQHKQDRHSESKRIEWMTEGIMI